MPNHVHGIIVMTNKSVDDGSTEERAGLKPAPTGCRPSLHGLSEIVRGFKTFSARRNNAVRGDRGRSFWQRNFFEHIIRDETSLNRIRRYITENPMRWDEDPENPSVRGGKAKGQV